MPKVQFLVWKDDYSVGVEILDRQHKRIFDTINTYYNSMLDVCPREMVLKTLKSLREYTHIHFQEEERLMKLHRYPGFSEQQAAHAHLMRETEDLIGQYYLSTADLSHDLFRFLKQWWTNHIVAMDRKYMPYLLEPPKKITDEGTP